jgi:mono/diheme cytochrome c family protein
VAEKVRTNLDACFSGVRLRRISMPKPHLLFLAGSLIILSSAFSLARSQSNPAQGSQAPAPAQAQPSAAAPSQAPAQGTPAPAMTPAQPITPAPATYPKNPVKPTAESQAKAKSLYQIDCAMCHGDNGNGKTDLATSMQLTLDDWTDSKPLAGHSDGELFLIIRNGKDKMPPEEAGRASDEAVWNLVFYIRGFSKSPGASASRGQN